MNMFEQMPFSEKYPVFRKLAEIGDLRKLSREELELYDEDIKNMRDIYATRKFDEKKGMEIGMAKGMAKGMEKEKLATARRLLSMGLSDEQVSTATELPALRQLVDICVKTYAQETLLGENLLYEFFSVHNGLI